MGEAGTGKEHRELPSPEVALARYSLSKSSGKETATDAIEIDVSQEDFAAMTNLARTTVGTVLRTLESRSTPDHRVAACSRMGTTIQEGKSACCTWQRSAWIVQFMR